MREREREREREKQWKEKDRSGNERPLHHSAKYFTTYLSLDGSVYFLGVKIARSQLLV